MNRILGIDYGSKRVGIAICDEAGQFAMPDSVIQNSPALLEEIKKLAAEKGVQEIVMGESKNYKGEANDILAPSLVFKQELEDAGFIVHLEPEYMTSMHAEEIQGKNDLSDASAAALILQRYLDKQKNSA